VTVRRSAESDDGATRTFLYDEWDFHAQAYLKGWCRLHEQRLLGDDHGFIRTVRDRHGELMQRIKRQFRAIRPEARQRVRRVSDGEELELDGIIDTVIDRRAGHATDERLYMRRDRALRDVAAAFLLDMSASTDIPVPDKDAPPPAPAPAPQAGEEDSPYLWTVAVAQDDGDRTPVRRVIDVGRESMALMCEALQTLGDRYAIYGFSGYGRDHVEFYVAKEFDDRLSARTWAAIGAMEPRKSTRMGPAIRHALAKLERQPTRMKVLVIVSDGFPQDCDYGPDRNDDEYGVQDTARALLEASRAGVETFLVTIDPTGHDYLRRMCADERYMIIDEVADLPEALTKVYRALTA
jgi:nitric oxide reductase activation protein